MNISTCINVPPSCHALVLIASSFRASGKLDSSKMVCLLQLLFVYASVVNMWSLCCHSLFLICFGASGGISGVGDMAVVVAFPGYLHIFLGIVIVAFLGYHPFISLL